MKAGIIGAGIGGLTTALFLQKTGFEIDIYEQAPELNPVGAGIILANNAMQIYDKLGIREEIELQGHAISAVKITSPKLSPISATSLKYFEKKYGVKNVAIHRGVLQEILLSELAENTLHLGHQLIGVHELEDKYQLEFSQGHMISTPVVIAADGLNSTIRNAIFPNAKVRNAKQICWRGVTNFQLPTRFQNQLTEAWGPGDRFGFVQINKEQVYWYALKKGNSEESIEGYLESFKKSYHSLIEEVLEATPTQNIHISPISDLQPIRQWHHHNICLIGDAAHATTPNLGQGACQAIEDAYVLTECLHQHEADEAFCEYQRLRMPKAHQVVNTSWRLGKMAHWRNPLATGLRNALMRSMPPILNRMQSDRIFKLTLLESS
ncbi:MAG: FAD-dependent monooxygenase [Cyclobacteriaceae bacterium]|nr:FAD-dependent monooxygenase [Cyclobacteriaceae bacterium HetDA_MAG_MS6]